MDLIAKPLYEDERLFCNDSLTFVFFLSQEKHGTSNCAQRHYMSLLGPFSVKVQNILRALNQIFKSSSFPGPSLIIGTTFVKRAPWPGLPDWQTFI